LPERRHDTDTKLFDEPDIEMSLIHSRFDLIENYSVSIIFAKSDEANCCGFAEKFMRFVSLAMAAMMHYSFER